MDVGEEQKIICTWRGEANPCLARYAQMGQGPPKRLEGAKNVIDNKDPHLMCNSTFRAVCERMLLGVRHRHDDKRRFTV